MSESTPSFEGGIAPSSLLCLRSIEYVEDGVYRIELLSKVGVALNTIGRVSDIDMGNGDVIQNVNFDSEDYGRLVMKGLIYSRPICHAVVAFHKARCRAQTVND